MAVEPVDRQRVDAGAAPLLATIWTQAVARRSGLPPPDGPRADLASSTC